MSRYFTLSIQTATMENRPTVNRVCAVPGCAGAQSRER